MTGPGRDRSRGCRLASVMLDEDFARTIIASIAGLPHHGRALRDTKR